jgi:hypothetical protein
MLLLTTTTDKLQLVTSAAVPVDVHTSYVDLSGTTVTPGRQNVAITTATTTDIVASPASSTTRNIQTLTVRNKHASTSCDVTLLFNQNGTTFELIRVTLRPSESLSFIDDVGFTVVAAPSAPPPNFSTTDQVANAADTYIAGSVIAIPTGRALAIGTRMIWKFAITKTAAGAATPIWSLRFGSGVLADTARVTLTGVAQTAAADVATVEIVCLVRSVGAAGVVTASLDLHHNLAATGFANVAHSVIQGTSSGFDTTTVTGVGISVNPGSAGVWTFTLVTAEVANL